MSSIDKILVKRGTDDKVKAYTGSDGELVINKDTKTIHIMDGSTAGGTSVLSSIDPKIYSTDDGIKITVEISPKSSDTNTAHVTRTYDLINVDYQDQNGSATFINGTAGLTAVGAGESIWSFRKSLAEWTGLTYATEKLYLVADNTINLITTANNWANKVEFSVNNQGLQKRNIGLNKGSTPTANTYMNMFMYDDCTGGSNWGVTHRIAGIESRWLASGTNGCNIIAYNNTEGSQSNASIGVQYDSNTKAYNTWAPKPPKGSNDLNIATTNWVEERLDVIDGGIL